MLLSLYPLTLLLLTTACADAPAAGEQDSLEMALAELAAGLQSESSDPDGPKWTGEFRATNQWAGQQEPGADGFAPIRFGDKEGWEWTEEFFPGTVHDSAITSPDAILGQTLGSRLAHHDEVLRCFETWAAESDRLTLHEYGRTYEGRRLVYAVITSAKNQGRIDAIRDGHLRLSDARQMSPEVAEAAANDLPAIAWMGYSIHGDETSGTEASMAVGYHLAAAQGKEIDALLNNVVVILDPCMNPDGRMRIVPMTEQMAGFRTSIDPASMSRGRWPYGRGNHYLFDMNRDWMAGVAPETRGRWAISMKWRPQLFVDAHEQGGSDTFLMYPQSKPRHPELPTELLKWQGVFADDHGAAFDGYGWGYYTREWADAWYPGYSDAWGSMNGAIGMLYEQARYAGQPYERPSGEVVPYRRAVHAQSLASLSNLRTLAANRSQILRDYYANRRSHSDGSRADANRTFAFVAEEGDPNATRFIDIMLRQGVEVWRATESFEATDVVHSMGESADSRDFPAGTYLIRALQPQGALVQAYLDFDPRMARALLQEERASLERGEGSNLYDITAWDLGRSYGLDASWISHGTVAHEPVHAAPAQIAHADKNFEGPAFAWAVDAADDDVVRFAARAMELGLNLHLSDEAFTGRADGKAYVFTRGSILIRRHENQGVDVDPIVARVAAETDVIAVALTTGRSPDLEQADLGGQHFDLLRRPRVALLAGPSVGTSNFGHVWQYLDEVLGVPVTLLNMDSLGRADLRDYNVIVAPPGASLRDAESALSGWVRNGGTLIALGSAATSIVDSSLSSVKLRSRVLDDLDDYAFAVDRHRAAGAEIDFADLWGDPVEAATDAEPEEETDDSEDGAAAEIDSDVERRESWMRRFSPQGVILRVNLNQESFLTVGRGTEIPVYTSGRSVLMSTNTVAGRYSAPDRLRLGGLLWPEARERIADSVWLTRERRGSGQVILFAQHPSFRGNWPGTVRLLGNAVVLGPGAGANPPPMR